MNFSMGWDLRPPALQDHVHVPIPKHRVMSQDLTGQAKSTHWICPSGSNTGERSATDFAQGWSWSSALDNHSGRGQGAAVWPRVPS